MMEELQCNMIKGKYEIWQLTLIKCNQFSTLDTNSATDALCSTLTAYLDNVCLLSSRTAHATPSDVLHKNRSKLSSAQRKWHKSKDPTDLSLYQPLLSSFSANVSTVKTTFYHIKINNFSDAYMHFKSFSFFVLPLIPQL